MDRSPILPHHLLHLTKIELFKLLNFIFRNVASTIHMPDVLETNAGTNIKFDIRSDRIEPQIDIEFSM